MSLAYFNLKRTVKSRGRMWADYNNVRVWLLDWIMGFGEILDGLICVLSLGFIFASFGYHISMYKLRFMNAKDLEE